MDKYQIKEDDGEQEGESKLEAYAKDVGGSLLDGLLLPLFIAGLAVILIVVTIINDIMTILFIVGLVLSPIVWLISKVTKGNKDD